VEHQVQTAAEALGMECGFPLVEMGYDPVEVERRVAALEAEIESLKSQLHLRMADDELPTRGREILLRAMNQALLSVYESVAAATREAEAYRRVMFEEAAVERSALAVELHSLREEVVRLTARRRDLGEEVDAGRSVETDDLADLRAALERELDACRELSRRLSDRLGVAASADLGAPGPADDRGNDPGEEAFRRFFDGDADEEPSRSWILSDE
jgi:hypothetical protein